MTEANSRTMAEAFCEKHMYVWAENGHRLADWRDPDVFADWERMLEHGGLGLVYPHSPDEDPGLLIAVFQDRSWIVQSDPYGGNLSERGTGEEASRFLDLIHRTLKSELDAAEDTPAFAKEQCRERFRQP